MSWIKNKENSIPIRTLIWRPKKLMFHSLVCEGSMFYTCFCFALLSVFSSFGEEERAGCFTSIVFLMYCECLCYVTLSHGLVV